MPIRYKLDKDARVSINIYDDKGQIVRELMHVVPRRAGDNLDVWDGLDTDGKPAPAGGYSWKLLATPGLKAQYLMSVGSNYPVNPQGPWWGGAPGTHSGPQSLWADDSGLYITGGTEGIDPAIVKISLDGATNLWSAQWPEGWNNPYSITKLGKTLWALTGDKGNMFGYDAATGARAGRMTMTADGENPKDLVGDGDMLALSYAKKGVRWWDPATQKFAEPVAALPGADGITANDRGDVYAISGKSVFKVRRDAPVPVELIKGLNGPRRLSIDSASGDLLIVECPSTYGEAYVKRYSPAGDLLATYGTPGGRQEGLYTPEKQNGFSGVFDIAAMPGGGFAVCEPFMPPRRVAVFDGNGKWQREWYGGQVWAPFVFPEPDNPGVVWMASDWNGIMRCIVDLKAKTWKVHSTYSVQANKLMGANGVGTVWEARVHNGELYFSNAGTPSVLRVDRKNWKLVPVVMTRAHLQHYKKYAAHSIPPFIAAKMGDNDSMVWTDVNGDGQVQDEEMLWSKESAPWSGASYTDDDLSYYMLDAEWGKKQQLSRYKVTGWNAVGAPVYPVSLAPERVGPEVELPGDAKLVRDFASGVTFGAANSGKGGWGWSEKPYVFKLDKDGKLAWTLGRQGALPGQIQAFRRAYGIVKDCFVVGGYSFEYPQEGVTRTWVWDGDGLFAGGLFDALDTDGIPVWRYALGGEALACKIAVDAATGDVLLYGHWVNEARIYRITGWGGWQRASGTLQLAQPAGTTGNGLLAEAFDAGGANRVAQWLATGVNFNPATDLKPLALPGRQAQSGGYSLRWSGQLLAPVDGMATFTLRSAGAVRLIVGDRVLVDRNKIVNSATDESGTYELKAGQRYALQVEFAPLAPGATKPARSGVQLSWTLPGQKPAPIPASALLTTSLWHQLPLGSGTGLNAEYFPNAKWEGAPSLTRVDPTVKFVWNTPREAGTPPIPAPAGAEGEPTQFSVQWKGFISPRSTGWYWFNAKGPVAVAKSAQPQDKVSPDPAQGSVSVTGTPVMDLGAGLRAYMEVGRKYPITVRYSSAAAGSMKTNGVTLLWSRRPDSTSGFMEPVPQTQLFPNE